jgi:signal transduction histidine kinase/ligand-binding sensor domain-containing protein
VKIVNRLATSAKLTCGVLFLVGAASTWTVPAQYRCDVFDTDAGLPQNSITGLRQTRDGYIWLTTNDGLARFDGLHFTVFNKSNSAEFTTNRLMGAFEDRSARLWFQGEDGSILFYKEGRFTLALKPNEITTFVRSPFFDDKLGGVIFSANYKTYRYQGGTFVLFPIGGLSGDSVLILADREGGLWFRSAKAVCRVKDGETTTFDLSRYSGGPYGFAYEDRRGSVWLSFTDKVDGNLVRIVDGRLQSYPFSARYAWDFAEDLAGNLWFTVRNQGVYRIDARAVAASEPMADAITQVAQVEGISATSNGLLCPDQEGGMWLGTDKGLMRFLPRTIRVFSKLDGLPEDNVYPIYEDRAGNVWAGVWKNSLLKFDGVRFNVFLKTPETFYVTSLLEDRQGCFWFGNIHTLRRLENVRPVDFTKEAGFQGETEFSVIAQDKDGNLWFGTDRGLSRYSNGRAAVFTTTDGLPDNYVTAFLQTRDGKIWIGTRGGVAVLAGASLPASRLAPVALTERDGLASNYIRSLYEDSDGVVWIGSYDGGLTRRQDGKFTRYSTRDGLHSNGVFCILEDNHGWLWMNSNQGIYRVRKQELNDFAEGRARSITSIAYNKQDGLLNVEGNGGRQPAGIKTRDGRLWFPTAQGIAVVDPETIATNTLPPPVLIEEVRLDRTPLANDLFQQAVGPQGSAVTLNPGQGNLEIQYTGLSFINSQQVKFKYKLEGLDPEWNDAGTRRVAYYSYLPPGRYTFRVMAANRDGVWSDGSASIQVIVLPPFYRTWWFAALAGLVVLGLATLAYQYRVRQLTRAKAAQEAFSRRLISSQENERKRIAAALHDSLNQSLVIIKNRAMLSLNSPDDKEHAFEQLEEIADGASQAIDEVREIAYNLRPFQLDRLGLTKAIDSMLRKVSGGGAIALVAELDPIDGLISKDSEINLYRIVQEGVNNIVKHARATEAQITLCRRDAELLLTICDNGIGFSPGAAGPDGSGFGLLGLGERAAILGGTIAIESSPGQGTTITVTVPIEGHLQ